MKETVMTYGLQGREVSEFVSNIILKNPGKSANRVMSFFLLNKKNKIKKYIKWKPWPNG